MDKTNKAEYDLLDHVGGEKTIGEHVMQAFEEEEQRTYKAKVEELSQQNREFKEEMEKEKREKELTRKKNLEQGKKPVQEIFAKQVSLELLNTIEDPLLRDKCKRVRRYVTSKKHQGMQMRHIPMHIKELIVHTAPVFNSLMEK